MTRYLTRYGKLELDASEFEILIKTLNKLPVEILHYSQRFSLADKTATLIMTNQILKEISRTTRKKNYPTEWIPTLDKILTFAKNNSIQI